jgi:hypothetical protein
MDLDFEHHCTRSHEVTRDPKWVPPSQLRVSHRSQGPSVACVHRPRGSGSLTAPVQDFSQDIQGAHRSPSAPPQHIICHWHGRRSSVYQAQNGARLSWPRSSKSVRACATPGRPSSVIRSAPPPRRGGVGLQLNTAAAQRQSPRPHCRRSQLNTDDPWLPAAAFPPLHRRISV